MIEALVQRVPPDRTRSVSILDVGCGNGLVSWPVARLGYRVTGVDMADIPDRDAMFARDGIELLRLNLNDPDPFASLLPASFDAVLMGEVIEHILNHPLAVLRSVARITRPGGVLVLTTPNPATLANALRVLLGFHTLWGTREFISMPKVDVDRQIISYEAIHYREYLQSELAWTIEQAGFVIRDMRYLPIGTSPRQRWIKRWLKGNPLSRWLATYRPFGFTHFVVAQRTDER
jgi:2-polyprenyl-3-methyl-5-hydroxy-6-metoxy-1,4-benzoquinol methylase